MHLAKQLNFSEGEALSVKAELRVEPVSVQNKF